MKRTWRVSVRLQVDDEDEEVAFELMLIDEDGRDKIVLRMVQQAVEKGFTEVNRAHRKLTVGEE